VNVEERVAALEALLEKVRTNAAKPRPARGPGLVAFPDAGLSAVPGDDVVGDAFPAPIAAAAATPPRTDAGAEELWGDVAGAQDPKLVALAPPLPGPGKETTPKPATAQAGTTPKPAPTAPTTTAAKPGPIAPTTTAAKPIAPTPTAAKPIAPTPTAAKPPLPTTTAAKPGPIAPVAPVATTPTGKAPPPATLPKLTPAAAQPAPIAPVAVAKPPAELKKTLQGVGIGDEPETRDLSPLEARDSDIITAPIALNAEQIELLLNEQQAADAADKKPVESEKKPPSLPSAIVEGEEGEEPTKLYEPSAASKRAAELAGAAPPASQPQPESKKKAPEPEPISLDLASEKKPEPAKQPEIELAAEPEKKPEPAKVEPEKKPEPAKVEPEKKPEPAKVEPEKKPEPVKTEPTKAPPPKKRPETTKQPVVAQAEPTPTPPETKKGGLPGWLLVVAALLLIAAGAFVAMQKGWIPGLGPQPGNTGPTTVTAPPTPTPAATPTAAPTEATTPTPTAAPTADPTGEPAATAAPTADPTAAPTAAPTADPGAAPAKDPTKLPPTRGILVVNANKPALVFLTGKLAGATGEQLEVDCGTKFVRLADPASTDAAKPPTWLTNGQPGMIACKALTTLTINIP
jgi:hypothetical protein